MSARVDSVFEAAMKLSEDERVQLADRLFFSVSPERQAELDRAWAAEAERRYRDYKDGKLVATDYAEAMKTIRAGLK